MHILFKKRYFRNDYNYTNRRNVILLCSQYK